METNGESGKVVVHSHERYGETFYDFLNAIDKLKSANDKWYSKITSNIKGRFIIELDSLENIVSDLYYDGSRKLRLIPFERIERCLIQANEALSLSKSFYEESLAEGDKESQEISNEFISIIQSLRRGITTMSSDYLGPSSPSVINYDLLIGSVLNFESDILVLRYPMNFVGIGRYIMEELEKRGNSRLDIAPALHDCVLVDSNGIGGYKYILYVGIESINKNTHTSNSVTFSNVLAFISSINTLDIEHIAVVNYDLNEPSDSESVGKTCFSGLVNAISRREIPKKLKRISVLYQSELDLDADWNELSTRAEIFDKSILYNKNIEVTLTTTKVIITKNTNLQSGENPDPLPRELVNSKAFLHTDEALKDIAGDSLDYHLYVENIIYQVHPAKAETYYDAYTQNKTDIWQGKDHTRPPLSIAVIAPWGHGKSSVMQMVKQELQQRRDLFYNRLTEAQKQHLNKNNISENKLNAAPTVRTADIRRWLRGNDTAQFPKLYYPMVWFNPWHYQSSDQIYSGFATTIVQQLIGYLSPEKQTEFWFRLSLSRIDRTQLMNELQWNNMARSIQAPATLISMVSAMAGVLASPSWLALSGISGLGAFAADVYKRNIKNAEETMGAFKKYAQPPSYTKSVGLFHEVQQDLAYLFDTLVDERFPLVIFVDDLDRCAPEHVAEVVEALNLFLSGNYAAKCYFIIGMDVEMVAAMLDVKYDKLQQALSSTREGEGLGMHFLDKLVQLPFYLPTLTDGKKQAYLDTLFAAEMEAERGLSQPGPDETVVSPAGKETATKKPGDEDAVTKLIDQVMQKPAADENSPADNVQLLATDKKARQRESFRELLRQSNDTEKIKEQLHEFVRFLGSDPRSIKRFVNLMRFYINQQKVRNEKSELDKTQFKAIAKWVIIMLRYHRLVRWIQWEKETELLQSTMPEDKASFIDITIRDIKGQFPPNEGQATDKAFEAWQSEIFMTQKQHHAVTSSGESVEATGNAPKDEARPADDNGLRQRKAWLADKLLFELLYMHNEEGSELMKALENNIW